MYKKELEKIMSDQIKELVEYKEKKSSELAPEDYIRLHNRLEQIINSYIDLFLSSPLD